MNAKISNLTLQLSLGCPHGFYPPPIPPLLKGGQIFLTLNIKAELA